MEHTIMIALLLLNMVMLAAAVSAGLLIGYMYVRRHLGIKWALGLHFTTYVLLVSVILIFWYLQW